ncbi:MAG: HDIG domain-containing metalloprotein [Peptococcia bacterium]
MSREEAVRELQKNIANRNLLNHCYAVEAIMRGLASHFGEDEEIWGLAGLLHDIDYEETKDDPARHSLVGGEMLEKLGLSNEIVYAVKCHNGQHGLERKGLMDKALFAADPLSGLIVAGALIRPEKKLAVVETDFLIKRFKEKGFARGANREQIASCTDMDLSLEEFITIGLDSMKKIAVEIGL